MIKLKKGYNINLNGRADNSSKQVLVKEFAIQPVNFNGLKPIPKMVVAEGDSVKAGSPLFFDKQMPSIMFVSPVSGTVKGIIRGAKRAIEKVVVTADETNTNVTYDKKLKNLSVDELAEFLQSSGAWPLINQRPFDLVPNPEDRPRDIFISTFDTAPLAPDNNFILKGNEDAFQKGVDVLNKLTEGKVHLGVNPNSDFTKFNNVVTTSFDGPHPAGNVGIQMHHTKPINIGDKVWTLTVQNVISIGSLFSNGYLDLSRKIALTGSQVKSAAYLDTFMGANIGELTSGLLEGDNNRIISGDVLSGKAKTTDCFLNFIDDQITVIKEGNSFEMFGWLVPDEKRPSVSKSFILNSLFPKKGYDGETNTHGERRAFVMTGQYEKLLPMDIYLQHLMKSIMYQDTEEMEGLGLLELSEEDVALCEFACTSKQPLQALLRDGLEYYKEQ